MTALPAGPTVEHEQRTPKGPLSGLLVDVSRVLSRRERRGDHFSGAAVADDLWRTMSCLTDLQACDPLRPRTTGTPANRRWSCLQLHAVGFAVPRPSPERAVRSYRTFSPLPSAEAGWRSVLCGTFPDSQPEPVGVTHHRVLSCSDFPPPRRVPGSDRPSTARVYGSRMRISGQVRGGLRLDSCP
jgi:hypothetical protein